MVEIYILIIAFLLDTLLGDPRWLPHLIVGFGKLISTGEKTLNNEPFQFFKGTFLTIILVTLTFGLGHILMEQLLSAKHEWLRIVAGSFILFYCIANRTLIAEGQAVFIELNKSLELGRARLSWIVGRETKNLNHQQIRIATFETMSENLSDGVIAPLFFFALLGVPGAMAYKMINTLDSMIGYRNERYENFGKFAAILDDVANYIPARLTTLLILIVSIKINGILTVFAEGKKHKSPNAGYPEAALAYVLNCRFGGPNYYFGQLVDKPYIGSNNRTIEHKEIHKVSTINMLSSILFITLVAVFLWK